jgi:hypothetical protein
MKVTPGRFWISVLLYTLLFILIWVCWKFFMDPPLRLPKF